MTVQDAVLGLPGSGGGDVARLSSTFMECTSIILVFFSASASLLPTISEILKGLLVWVASLSFRLRR